MLALKVKNLNCGFIGCKCPPKYENKFIFVCLTVNISISMPIQSRIRYRTPIIACIVWMTLPFFASKRSISTFPRVPAQMLEPNLKP